MSNDHDRNKPPKYLADMAAWEQELKIVDPENQAPIVRALVDYTDRLFGAPQHTASDSSGRYIVRNGVNVQRHCFMSYPGDGSNGPAEPITYITLQRTGDKRRETESLRMTLHENSGRANVSGSGYIIPASRGKARFGHLAYDSTKVPTGVPANYAEQTEANIPLTLHDEADIAEALETFTADMIRSAEDPQPGPLSRFIGRIAGK